MDYSIASALNVHVNKLRESFSIFEKLINIKSTNTISITQKDKIYLLYLLNNVKDNCNYCDFPGEKLYIYLTLIIVHFRCEYCSLYTDVEFNKKLFLVVKNTNIISHIFKLL